MSSRNILNVPEVDRLVDDLAQLTDEAELQSWLRRNARRWILKHHDHYDRIIRNPATGELVLIATDSLDDVVPRLYAGEVPAWCAAALLRGDEVLHLRLGASLHKRLRRAAAALEALLQKGEVTSLERMDFPTAEDLAKERRAEPYLVRQSAVVREGTTPVHQAGSLGSVVQLKTYESLKDEGVRMKHCVAIYGDDVADGACEIYSLRDRDDRSRATLEVDEEGQVWQVQGFANGALAPRDRLALRDFFRRRGYEVKGDRHNLHLSQADFTTDVAILERHLFKGGGLDALRAARYSGDWSVRQVDANALLYTLIANRRRLQSKALRAVWSAVRPEDARVLRLRMIRDLGIYDFRLRLCRVEMPVPLINFVRFGVFRGQPFEAEARRIYQAAEGALINLAFRGTDWVFALGPRGTETGPRGLLESPADVLLHSQIDVSGLRARRHLALRRRLNLAKRREVGRRGAPCGGHLAVRRLLDGAGRDYVL